MGTPGSGVRRVTRLPVRGLGLLAAVILLAGGPACTRSEDAPNATPTAGSPAPAGPCAWPNRADKDTNNVAYPDTGATYWSTSYVLAPGEHLELRGVFPAARYFSFITYGPAGGAIATLTDRDIRPDPGSTNPFAGEGGEAGGRYTVAVRGDTAPAPNSVTAAASAATGSTGTNPPGTAVPVNRATLLGSGEPGAPGVVGGTVIYRVYLATDAHDPTGRGGLPDVRLVRADGAETAVSTCPNPSRNPAAEAIVNASGRPTNTPAPARPVFIRPGAGAANLFPNPDNVYVATIVHHTPGQVVVVRGRAPTFPDTAHGRPVTGHEQVRYWSLCTDEYRKPYPVSFCVADQDIALDGDGNYTFVVSTAADRPADADAAHGVTWLEWGTTEVDNLLLLRHMLADPGFSESALNLAPGAQATSTMGAYAPRGAYCSTEAFSQGPDRCPTP